MNLRISDMEETRFMKLNEGFDVMQVMLNLGPTVQQAYVNEIIDALERNSVNPISKLRNQIDHIPSTFSFLHLFSENPNPLRKSLQNYLFTSTKQTL
jgi:hypothetical protein